MKEFKKGDVVTSQYGVSIVGSASAVRCFYVDFKGPIGLVNYTVDGRENKHSPISLFHGRGKVDIVFTPEPVYVYKWLYLNKHGATCLSTYYKTEEEFLSYNGYVLKEQIIQRIEGSKTELKE